MKKFFLGAVALVLGLSFVSSADASGHRGHGHRGHGHRGHGTIGNVHRHTSARPYYATHGVRFNGGYYYRGNDHHHWSSRVWSGSHNRYHYWDPYRSCYYYYCPQRCGYFPVGCTLP